MSAFVSWPDISSFDSMRAGIVKYYANQNLDAELPTVCYRAKPKMHGVNVGIRVNADGTRQYQSRSGDINRTNDLHGFVAMCESLPKDYFAVDGPADYVIFGEWFGPGVKVKGREACRFIQKKCFGVFALYTPFNDILIVEPDSLKALITESEQIRILPWVGDLLTVDLQRGEACETFAGTINTRITDLEQQDSWVRAVFNVDGPGEGLVLYPVNGKGTREEFEHRAFKAKTLAHAVKETKAPVVVSPEVLQGAEAFAHAFVTEARCHQGFCTLSDTPSIKDIGQFLDWMNKDILKESVHELEASGLVWKDVVNVCTTRARQWYLHEVGVKEYERTQEVV